jgi:hypothetical protein
VVEATVEAEGFRFEGKLYRSLSAIALTVTGTRWNGPRFFGLRSGATGRETGKETAKETGP